MAEMNTNSAKNVSTSSPKITGAIYYAPIGTVLPTDANTALNVAFKGVGYISEEGVTRSQARSSNDVKEWGGGIVATVQTEYSETFKFKMIEALNDIVQKAVYGDANVEGKLVAASSKMTVKHNASEPKTNTWVIDTVMLDGTLSRIVIPNAKITELGDLDYKKDSAIGYDVTLKAMLDDKGNTSYDYYQMPAA
ncbi:phage tail protein [Bulleidia sp. zg-1006]|uniref:phage tail tube protein n=1 Tax=Bulleidia sp. zg-1006 TaxID=2806552 RepID=UPI00193A81F5|nr:phage tail protein [Bulleidia sp. zg-1006]QRG86372.1 phage tail protein [Bulleidia sp. zg-1006]